MKLAKKLGLTISSLPVLITTDSTDFTREFDLVRYTDKTEFIQAAIKSMIIATGQPTPKLVITNLLHKSADTNLISKHDVDENIWLCFKTPKQGHSVYAAYAQCCEKEDYKPMKAKLVKAASRYMGHYANDEAIVDGYLSHQKLNPDLLKTVINDIDKDNAADMRDIAELIMIEIPNFDNHFFLPTQPT